MSSPPDPASLLALLRQTRSLLASHLALGVHNYPATPALRQFAAARPATPAALLPRSQPVAAEPSVPTERPRETADKPHAPALSLPVLAQQLAECRRCPAHSMPPVSGTGSASPKLMVVSSRSFQEKLERGLLLGSGEAEDELFWKMMAAIGLNRETVYVTNLAKCVQQDIPAAERSCLFWLEQELRQLQPRLICAMGEAAAQLLIGKTAPLIRLRGTLHPCRLPAAPQAQVLATYHPHFLLQQPALKQAAWADLQKAQQRLADLHAD
jgi:uracil-DNA glycosylase